MKLFKRLTVSKSPCATSLGPKTPITPETPRAERAHNPVFGTFLKERMDRTGVECVLRFREAYADAGPDSPLRMNQEQVRF